MPGESRGRQEAVQGVEAPPGVGQCGHGPGAPELDEGPVGHGPCKYWYHFLIVLHACTGCTHTTVVTHFTHAAPCLSAPAPGGVQGGGEGGARGAGGGHPCLGACTSSREE